MQPRSLGPSSSPPAGSMHDTYIYIYIAFTEEIRRTVVLIAFICMYVCMCIYVCMYVCGTYCIDVRGRQFCGYAEIRTSICMYVEREESCVCMCVCMYVGIMRHCTVTMRNFFPMPYGRERYPATWSSHCRTAQSSTATNSDRRYVCMYVCMYAQDL